MRKSAAVGQTARDCVGAGAREKVLNFVRASAAVSSSMKLPLLLFAETQNHFATSFTNGRRIESILLSRRIEPPKIFLCSEAWVQRVAPLEFHDCIKAFVSRLFGAIWDIVAA
jgi:hypothetical protein